MGQYKIRCAEIWGGVDEIDTDIATTALTASVYSKSAEGARGGDIYYFSVCGSDQLTRVAIADVQGHGEEVSKISAWLYELVRDSMDSLDATQVLSALNARVLEHGFEAMSTAALLSYYLGDRQLYVSYAGHPPALLQRHADHAWTALSIDEGAGISNMSLGILPNVTYDQKVLPLGAGDRLLLYSDGISEYPDLSGEPIGSDWLMQRLGDSRGRSPWQVKQEILAGLSAENPEGMQHDDMTLMVLDIDGPATRSS
jgi:sigma-B regulation protein RsbU (phosphoserine phosphatase)